MPPGTNHRELVETIKAALPLDKRHLVQSYYLAPGEETSLSILVEDDRPEVDFLNAFDSGFITRTQLTELIEHFEQLKTTHEGLASRLIYQNSLVSEIARDSAKSSADAYGFCIIRLRCILPSPPVLDPSPQNLIDFDRIKKSDLQSIIDEIEGLFKASTTRYQDGENDIHVLRRAKASADAYAECLLRLRPIQLSVSTDALAFLE